MTGLQNYKMKINRLTVFIIGIMLGLMLGLMLVINLATSLEDSENISNSCSIENNCNCCTSGTEQECNISESCYEDYFKEMFGLNPKINIDEDILKKLIERDKTDKENLKIISYLLKDYNESQKLLFAEELLNMNIEFINRFGAYDIVNNLESPDEKDSDIEFENENAISQLDNYLNSIDCNSPDEGDELAKNPIELKIDDADILELFSTKNSEGFVESIVSKLRL